MSDARTEKILAEKFRTSDQLKWQARSLQAEQEIYKMLLADADLTKIYEFARLERSKMAYDLDPKQPQVERFGQLRGYADFHSDYYDTDSIAGSRSSNSSSVFKKILSIIKPQLTSFNKKKLTSALEVGSTIFRPKQNQPIYEYELMCPDQSRMAAYEDNEIKLVQYSWPPVNNSMYPKKMAELNKQLDEIKKSPNKSEETLFKIGLLTYDLSRLVLLKRGSAAVNGWIVRALSQLKGFEIEALRVQDLPYDVYAQVQSNREQYARDFVSNLKPESIEQCQYAARTLIVKEYNEKKQENPEVLKKTYNSALVTLTQLDQITTKLLDLEEKSNSQSRNAFLITAIKDAYKKINLSSPDTALEDLQNSLVQLLKSESPENKSGFFASEDAGIKKIKEILDEIQSIRKPENQIRSEKKP